MYCHQETAFQKVYYDYFKRAGGSRQQYLFPFLPDGYAYHYRLMREVFWELQPFQFLREGDRVIQVGFTDPYLRVSISHPLIMAAIVGESGHVWAIDCDRRNIDALDTYVDKNDIHNITVVEAAIWEKCGPVGVELYGRASANALSPVVESVWGWWAPRVSGLPHDHVSMEAITLDVAIEKFTQGSSIDFVNITINGAEGACMRGATGLMENCQGLTFAFPAGNVKPEEYGWLEGLGFDVGLAHAPHAPWEPDPCLYACARRSSVDTFESLGFEWLSPEELGNLPWRGEMYY